MTEQLTMRHSVCHELLRAWPQRLHSELPEAWLALSQACELGAALACCQGW